MGGLQRHGLARLYLGLIKWGLLQPREMNPHCMKGKWRIEAMGRRTFYSMIAFGVVLLSCRDPLQKWLYRRHPVLIMREHPVWPTDPDEQKIDMEWRSSFSWSHWWAVSFWRSSSVSAFRHFHHRRSMLFAHLTSTKSQSWGLESLEWDQVTPTTFFARNVRRTWFVTLHFLQDPIETCLSRMIAKQLFQLVQIIRVTERDQPVAR